MEMNGVIGESRRELLSPLPEVDSVVINTEFTELPSWRLSINEFQLPKPTHPSFHPLLCLNPTRSKSIFFFNLIYFLRH